MMGRLRKRGSSTKWAVLTIAALALGLFCSPSHAVSYDPSTTIVVYIHGFDNAGYLSTGLFGDDSTDSDVLDAVVQMGAFTGRPTWQENPAAPNQVCGATYYGTTVPAWYTADDIAADNAAVAGVPRYALRMAKYINHVIQRSGAASCNIVSGSFGTEITRYLIEHNLCSLASNQMISRWEPVVGVLRGNWAAQNVPGWLADALGGDSPDIDQMTYDWVSGNISANTTMNSAYYGPMIITQYVATDDNDGYITAIHNYANDGTNLSTDEYFAGYTNAAALHTMTDGTQMMPGLAFYPTIHTGIADHMGMWASVAAAAENNKRVTVKISRFKALKSGDTWLLGKGEWVYSARTVSPMAATLYGVTVPLADIKWQDGVSPKYSLSANQTIYPNNVIFDQILVPGETSLQITFNAWELDNAYTFYNVVELSGNTDMGTLSTTVSTTANSTVTIGNSNFQADFTTTIKNAY